MRWSRRRGTMNSEEEATRSSASYASAKNRDGIVFISSIPCQSILETPLSTLSMDLQFLLKDQAKRTRDRNCGIADINRHKWLPASDPGELIRSRQHYQSAMNNRGHKILLRKLDRRIFDGLVRHLVELVQHPIGNHVI
ncbi:hypothetical protein AXF42_Ash019275 [Apostasia shenzhenica]|uniref:Uncharacterized protein n=1 Tax=Apostasia shenzhenica TaxID=1088818 RepID=A0A2I0AR74_9ASPA|nr:hypothetical protein AXF42_Ash019275 [Apostasia shenzhenica]